MNRWIATALLSAIVLLVGCANSSTGKSNKSKKPPKQTPNNYYNAGMLRCSVGSPTFDDVCDYAVYYKNKRMRIVVENSAITTSIAYRIFYFGGGKFKTKNKKEVVRSQKLASNHYQISVGREYYLMPIRALTYQPIDDNMTSTPQSSTPLQPVIPKSQPIQTPVTEVIKSEPIVQPKPVIVKRTKPKSKGTKRKFKR